MVVSQDVVEVSLEELVKDKVLVASESALGNGSLNTIQDIVYVKPDRFDASQTRQIAHELEVLNRQLVSKKHPYLLIGFGRWGTTDPQGGIPVNFGQISGAKVIVEATLPGMNFMLSQGSHFFHNITSFQICYFSLSHGGKYQIDWEWLNQQRVKNETEYIRHVNLPSSLKIKIDGRTGRGVIHHE